MEFLFCKLFNYFILEVKNIRWNLLLLYGNCFLFRLKIKDCVHSSILCNLYHNLSQKIRPYFRVTPFFFLSVTFLFFFFLFNRWGWLYSYIFKKKLFFLRGRKRWFSFVYVFRLLLEFCSCGPQACHDLIFSQETVFLSNFFNNNN